MTLKIAFAGSPSEYTCSPFLNRTIVAIVANRARSSSLSNW